MVNIIGFTGKAGSGKDYCANVIVKLLPSYKKIKFIAFADHMKLECMDKYNISFDELYINKTDNIRNIMQQYGTENGRDKRGEDVWINMVNNWFKIFNHRENYDYLFITDVRFQNEYEWIKEQNGIIIQITNNSVNQLSHISENNNINFDYTINNNINNNQLIDDINNIVEVILDKNKKRIQIIQINNQEINFNIKKLINKDNILLYYETYNIDQTFIQDFKKNCIKFNINNVEMVCEKDQLYQKYYDYDLFE